MSLPFDVSAHFQKTNCEYCHYIGVDCVTHCKHFYHLRCLTLSYFYRKACWNCNAPFEIKGLDVLKPYQCFICQSQFNLVNCMNCKKSHCTTCISSHELVGCCRESALNLQYFVFECPGCNFERTYEDLAKVRCPTHPLLCKMCWNACAYNKKCILGCELNFAAGYFIECKACRKKGLRYFGNEICLNSCDVCEACMRQHYLKENLSGRSVSCVYCGDALAKKLSEWDDSLR